ncbi:FAD-dependent monooxygenase [Actinoplanes derwentensis]|uniref:2-polyprenyl-6-methoxyphenol hydroxylase n=1 Tax=Actinoplanes derwentensis TaxID=113562 RepID=A0A1H2BHY7_9ACTN|nr:FAD-dependent monooxygenase [Actinoplanes derwentensis]GID87827.1 FAD-dependent oxidoreductase [Actinoplanes derwentensis]SDT57754.1 2-polyprenyl-6-methoxyphenol hydroxylase [Actinoplanes derwentensis]
MDDVLVVGGGIAGLALARALHRLDVPVTVAERGTEDSGLALNLPGNAIAAFAALGLAEDLQKLGRPTTRREYRTRRDRLLFTVDEDAFWGPEARPRCVRHAELLTLLAEGLDDRIRCPLEVTEVHPSGRVTFQDQTQRRYGYIAGADGIHSLVRATVDPTAPPPVVGPAGWRFLAPNPGIDCWTLWSGRDAAFLLTPVDDSEVYGYATTTAPTGLHETFARFPAPVRQTLTTVTDPLPSPVRQIRTTTWSTGRCALVGDAAHATAPFWAQGAALAVEDGLVLADVLTTSPWDEAGAAYTALRQDRIAQVRTATAQFTRVAALPPWFRDLLLPTLGPRTYRSTYARLRHPFPTP